MTTPAEDFLEHYSSQYYDPQKAHEYYERTKELKGRQSTKGMSKTQTEAWGYAKNQISQAKKSEMTASQEAQKRRLEALRLKAEEAQKRITDKIRALAERLENQRNASGVDPKLKRYLERSHGNLIRKAQKDASAEREQIRTELKSAVQKARDEYHASKEQLKAKYDQATDTEYNNIRSQLPGEAPKAPAKKRGRKNTQNGTKT
ncbi:hypothetical protein SEA_GOCRAZY_10 [Arthrobacter phage GoCrazy]|uniref:Uncharacterized protein n=9 Tax=Mudcatvirus TaxID=1982088 RepID=A0A222Z8Q9_9CAUD|nr:hypothetical protein BI184_gp11 [Arthrobacter phage Mudcat]YP_010665999.1 hypothetical protein PQB74_gp11 [Arthrobacter phage Arcadia]YP_010666096.1 hypothetical protein PQB75_gp011 [Arthrobacter phage Tribby]YP_010666198.1 hypothetical protein PQB76_gp011 [Arthrobacter phage Cheesy]YP_010666299.1 hypothetical protein PQB77_gp11 [Arthrobacter phage Correa]YP_010666394.1 hypothetical protein PQB78_gp10 [Arthrobacter phage Xenomorph]YP_010666689.1 hypothetical protein PQB81_gp010 [Arthrobact